MKVSQHYSCYYLFLAAFLVGGSVYKVGEYIKDVRYGDIWEIIDISGTQPLDYVKLGKKFDSGSYRPVGYIYNIMCNYRDLKSMYVKLPAARLLLQNSIKR